MNNGTEKPVKWEDAIFVNCLNGKGENPILLATQEHFSKFPRQWEAFQNTDEYKAFVSREESGENLKYTALHEITSSPSVINQLRAININSAEQLLDRYEDAKHIRGIAKVREKAQRVTSE